MHNILLNTDSYKVSMPVQYPEGTEHIFSYIESRGGKYGETVFFGLQAFIKEYLTNPITKEDIDLAEEIWSAHGEPFDRSLWDYILDEHKGILPIEIKAVPEGSAIPVHNILVSIVNTDPKCFWLTTWLETALLRAIWYPSTVATNSREIKKVIKQYLEETGDVSGLSFKLHDFGGRGTSSQESAMIGGMAHLINFMGTDTISGVLGARKYYNELIAGFSIPAAEHSTITSWGKENEVKAYENMLKQFAKPGSLVAVVSDSYNIYYAVGHLWGEELRQKVIDSGATLVVRPDSGDPADVVTTIAHLLDEKFGSVFNNKGYKVLNHVRIIQGDGVNIDSITAILESLKKHGFSADNIAFGMGGALLQNVTRDDQKWAMKCSAAKINDQWIDVYKDPITDKGKTSKKGLLKLIHIDGIGGGVYRTVNQSVEGKDLLKTVYLNGELVREINFSEVRKNAELV